MHSVGETIVLMMQQIHINSAYVLHYISLT